MRTDANTLALKGYAGLLAICWLSVLLAWLGVVAAVVPVVLFCIFGVLLLLALAASSLHLFGMR